MSSPSKNNTDPATRPLRRGDLVRVSKTGAAKAKRLRDREDALGRVAQKHERSDGNDDGNDASTVEYEVEWILGGRTKCQREDLVWRTADQEGLTEDDNAIDSSIVAATIAVGRSVRSPTPRRRDKRKPLDFMSEVMIQDEAKRVKKEKKKEQRMHQAAAVAKKKAKTKAKVVPKAKVAVKAKPSKKPVKPKKEKTQKKEKRKVEPNKAGPSTTSASSETKETITPTAMDLYEKHRRDFERCLTRLEEKIDCFRHFWEDAPPEFDELYDDSGGDGSEGGNANDPINKKDGDVDAKMAPTEAALDASEGNTVTVAASDDAVGATTPAANTKNGVCQHPPYNWTMIRRRMTHGRYMMDRLQQEEEERIELLRPYYKALGKKSPNRRHKPSNKRKLLNTKSDSKDTARSTSRVLYPFGVDWELFRQDVFAMCEAALARQSAEDQANDDGYRGSMTYSAVKVKETLDVTLERTGARHVTEMKYADDRHKFAIAIEQSNTEAAMQSWRKVPFPERKYERLSNDVVCAGLSQVDEQIATYELRTNLPDSFIGQSYRYDDTGQSEAWMKSVVDETGSSQSKCKRKKASDETAADVKHAALAMSADEGVTRAQVAATMQSLLIGVQDKVMTGDNVLRQPELKSANWIEEKGISTEESSLLSSTNGQQTLDTQIIERPVWGIDCYTRRNILNCLEIEFDSETALFFVEKWLLPAINSCPEHLAHNIVNAACILEGLPFEIDSQNDAAAVVTEDKEKQKFTESEAWGRSMLGKALSNKIIVAGPPWLKAAANQLRRARSALGPDFFRVHPKGHGSLVLSPTLKANTLVTFYRGELYPSWRWGEKMDAIDITQSRKELKPALPDFYNMALERPQTDPRGYGLLFVDASRKAGHGSSLSHSCAPTCEVRVAALKGELCLAMTTLRELETGEELTFDYNAVTESLNEYSSAVCLCGYSRCRGSFLHFATADCYQQVLNRNSPIASRFASLVKGSMKQVMSQDDEQVLGNHGFLTASFGAISVNRRVAENQGQSRSLVDSLDMVPVWLRTYVADTLRYIEYERRALPIALICDHLSTAKSDESKAISAQPTKEPKLEPPFFYFSRTESSFLLNLLKNEGVPSSLKGLQLKHTMQKVASGYWSALADEKKQYWKDKAKADYQKKLKAWRSGKKNLPNPGKKKAKGKSKPGIDEILHSSKISFQDADAEGVVAMEQRIQQLTQSLCRVGRVLDRHREATFATAEARESKDDGGGSLRKLPHSPLRVLRDDEVVDWMWNRKSGVVQSLLSSVKRSRCVRSELLHSLNDILKKYSTLEAFDDCTVHKNENADAKPADGRELLVKALLEFRSTILEELKDMAKEFRSTRETTAQQLSDDNNTNVSSEIMTSDDEAVVERKSVDSDDENDTDSKTNQSAASVSVLPTASDGAINKMDTEDNSQLSHESNGSSEKKDGLTSELPIQPQPWADFYSERFTLHAAADLLLLYANTSNFFLLRPYESLESTPVEVYARELGNVVPKSVVDTEVAMCEQIQQVTSTTDTEVQGGNSPLQSGDTNLLPQGRRNKSEICAPDDIVAKVTVRYQGDYVLSQLLQWYNAGIGQKPGLPDLLGCTMLPSMNDCWNSELLAQSKLKAYRKTTYECKVRPRLIEWLQDPYQRGNPWPSEIRKAFAEKDAPAIQLNSSGQFVPFGSPVIDFLVSGEESNISAILFELDALNKVTAKKSADGLLSSVDKGRPAQAVSTWVQCENAECSKWRKIPWHVDADLLPEKFFCSDNKWNLSANFCDAPEDDWDAADALVGSDGKVEGSPFKKVNDENMSVLDELSFRVGNRFDVKRKGKDQYSVAFVTKADFSGVTKRIMFHWPKTSPDRDEWIEFKSPRIAPLYSKVQRKPSKPCQKAIDLVDKKNPDSKEKATKKALKRTKSEVDQKQKKVPSAKKLCSKDAIPLDPKNELNFQVGARFDVSRSLKGKERFYEATVKEVDFAGPAKRIHFHFIKTAEKFDEWVEFGSERICEFNSKVSVIKEEKKKKRELKMLKQQEKLLAAAKYFKVDQQREATVETTTKDFPDISCSTITDKFVEREKISTHRETACSAAPVISSDSTTILSSPCETLRQVSKENAEDDVDGGHAHAVPMQSSDLRDDTPKPLVEDTSFHAESHNNKSTPVLNEKSSVFFRSDDQHHVERSNLGARKSLDSGRSTIQHLEHSSTQHEELNSRVPSDNAVSHQVRTEQPSRPPDFSITAFRAPQVEHPNRYTLQSYNERQFIPATTQYPSSLLMHSKASNGTRRALSGLDILAAVTDEHAFAASNISSRLSYHDGHTMPPSNQNGQFQNISHRQVMANSGMHSQDYRQLIFQRDRVYNRLQGHRLPDQSSSNQQCNNKP